MSNTIEAYEICKVIDGAIGRLDAVAETFAQLKDRGKNLKEFVEREESLCRRERVSLQEVKARIYKALTKEEG